ncbi:MAG: hypothetical protein D6722_24750 [Bacteroidetes bacterium]|nr:MAG: hypothetical protein D6722_24750 [Bacteroidota bacterium]
MGDDDGHRRWLQLVRCAGFRYEEVLETPIALPNTGLIRLRLQWERDQLTFAYRTEASPGWLPAGGPQAAHILSDDFVRDGSDRYRPAFAGAMVGVACQDLTGLGWSADIRRLVYRGR